MNKTEKVAYWGNLLESILGNLNFLVMFFLMAAQPASADIYIDTSQSEEIKISSTSLNLSFSITIEEPVEQSWQGHTSAVDTDISTEPAILSPDEYAKLPFNKLPFNKEVMAAAKATALNPALIHAVIATESRHNPYAKSHKGAVGLMQLMPATARKFKVKNKQDPKQNILAGSRYLRELLTQFNGDLTLSLAAYNAGPGAVIKYQHKIPPYKETRHYVPKVLKYYRQYS